MTSVLQFSREDLMRIIDNQVENDNEWRVAQHIKNMHPRYGGYVAVDSKGYIHFSWDLQNILEHRLGCSYERYRNVYILLLN